MFHFGIFLCSGSANMLIVKPLLVFLVVYVCKVESVRSNDQFKKWHGAKTRTNITGIDLTCNFMYKVHSNVLNWKVGSSVFCKLHAYTLIDFDSV